MSIQESKLKVTWGADIKTVDPKYLWYPYIPLEEITLLAAAPKVGKGIVGASLAAMVSKGGFCPCSSERAPDGCVLWLEAEDSLESTVAPRLIAAGADMKRVALRGHGEVTPAQLRAFVGETRAKLVVVSPLKAYLETHQPNEEIEARKAMEAMHGTVRGLGCAIVGIIHTNKKPGLTAMERIAGSGAYTQYARSAILLRREPGDGLRRLMHGWTNVGVEGDDLLFELEHTGDPRLPPAKRNPRSQFVKANWKLAEDNADLDTFFESRQGIEGDETALEWLVVWLQGKGLVPREEVLAAGQTAGHSESALRAAFTKGYKDKLLGSYSRGFGRDKRTCLGLNLPQAQAAPAERIEFAITRPMLPERVSD
jgi:hypothetical protein